MRRGPVLSIQLTAAEVHQLENSAGTRSAWKSPGGPSLRDMDTRGRCACDRQAAWNWRRLASTPGAGTDLTGAERGDLRKV